MHLPLVLTRALLRGMATFVVASVFLSLGGSPEFRPLHTRLLTACGAALLVSALTLVEWLVIERQLTRRGLVLAVFGVWLLAMCGSIALVLQVMLVSELRHGLSFEQSLHNVLYLAQLGRTQWLIPPVILVGALSVALALRVLSASAPRRPYRELVSDEGGVVVLTPLMAGYLFSMVVAVADEWGPHAFTALMVAATLYPMILAPAVVIGAIVLLLGYGLVDRLAPAAEP